MSELFGTKKLEFGPVLSSGLAPWVHEVKPKSGDNYKFVPLHSLEESMSIWVHRQQVKYDGGFKYVVSGKKLEPAVESPFDTDPRKEVNGIKPLYYMLVYVIAGNDNLKDHVGFLELRQNLKKRDGTFDRMATYEKESEIGSVKGIKCSLSRIGSGLNDTVYQSSITDKYTFKKDEIAVIDREVPELVAHLKGLYLKTWTPQEFTRIYNEGIVNNKAPKAVETVSEIPDAEIPF